MIQTMFTGGKAKKLVKVVDKTWIYDDKSSMALGQNPGVVEWYDHNGMVHGHGHPAVVWADGSNSWYRHGKLHRLNFPAVVDRPSRVIWFLHGHMISDNEVDMYNFEDVRIELVDYPLGDELFEAGLIRQCDRDDLIWPAQLQICVPRWY